ncbi:MAG: type II toxin-antitoxin system prevent-host-death family antitoxin [Bifidobacteriaceae bacterium]|jgi:prevent-host-death family protein|nr:type II toxin-antitoxin system prevent-host-death family antitoxin [Bifidobacteriaceae bacterium]
MAEVATSPAGERVGLRDLRGSLAAYAAAVQDGRSFTVTDRGRPVARLTPVQSLSTYERLVAEGVIRPAPNRPGKLQSPVEAAGRVSDLITEQRR